MEPSEASGVLANWLKPLVLRSSDPAVEPERPTWTVVRSEETDEVTLRLYPHLDALGISFSMPLARTPRLRQLELMAALNDDLAFARFTITASDKLVAEYMMACGGQFMPAALEDMVKHLIDIQDSVRGVLEAWDMAATESRQAEPPVSLLS